MRRPRWRWLPPLLVTLIALGANAATLKRRDSLGLGWEGKDLYYVPSKSLFCQKCPAGTYVAEDCKEQSGSSRCVPCEDGEYMEYPNGLQWCRECLKCREDQVELSPCQADRNTVCACRNGTFCTPDHPCEMCQKCQPRCPEGQVVLKPCTPYSDLQCGPAADSGSAYSWVIIPGIATVVLIAIIGGYMWKRRCRSPGDGRPSSRRPYEMVTSMLWKLPWSKRENAGREDNAANERTQDRQRATATETERMLQSGSAMPESASGTPKRTLVPGDAKENPMQSLRLSFYIFARKVPRDNWKKFGRSLDLEENDIVQDPKDAKDEDFFDMLLKWQSREGTKSSVNMLLDTLERLNLGGVAEDVTTALVQEGLFKYTETS